MMLPSRRQREMGQETYHEVSTPATHHKIGVGSVTKVDA